MARTHVGRVAVYVMKKEDEEDDMLDGKIQMTEAILWRHEVSSGKTTDQQLEECGRRRRYRQRVHPLSVKDL